MQKEGDYLLGIMGQQTEIAWCDSTFNPWEGCTKVSPGCAHCYAEARNNRFGGGNWGKGKPRRRTSQANWKKPLQWNKTEICLLCGTTRPIYGDCGYCRNAQCKSVNESPATIDMRRPRVFCASLADWLDDEVPIEWLADLLKLIHETPNLNWLLLTKRPENFQKRMDEVSSIMDKATKDRPHTDAYEDAAWFASKWANQGPANIWLGVSVEDQQRANERIPELLKIPARIRFLSVEPMLEQVTFWPAIWNVAHNSKDIHWAIFGGESGSGARPCNVDWIRDGVRQCRAARVAPFVKQFGARPYFTSENDYPANAVTRPIEFKDKKGGDMSEWPEDLRIREFPKA